MFIDTQQNKHKAKGRFIDVIIQDESYTPGCSFFDDETIVDNKMIQERGNRQECIPSAILL